MTLAAIGDLHIGKLDYLREEFSDFQIEALKNTLASVVGKGIGHVAFLGDVFDVPDPQQYLTIKLMACLLQFDLVYHIIPGNHDRHSIEEHSCMLVDWMSSTKLLKAHVYSKPTLKKVDGDRVWFCPHPFIEDQPGNADFSVGHFAWTGARRDSGSKNAQGHTPKGRWILGDYHTPQAGSRYIYAGSLTQLSMGEKPEKRYLVVDKNGADSVRVENTYRLKQVIVETDREFRDLSAGEKTYLNVTCAKGVKPPENWQEKFPFVLRMFTEKAAQAVDMAKMMEDIDPLDNLEDFLKERAVLSDKQIKKALEYTRGLGG